MLRGAIEHIVSDPSFHIPVEPAATALSTARSVLEWVSQEENQTIFSAFEDKITSELSGCIGVSPEDAQSFRTKKLELCRSYHQFRISDEFTTTWLGFLRQVKCNPVATFYQEVTDIVFEHLLKSVYPLEMDNITLDTEDITYEDANVVRYMAGYVCRKVNTKIANSPFPNKTVLQKCLQGLLQDDGASSASASADWIDAVDRGGLWHVREGTFMLFCAMEEVVREYLHVNNVSGMTEEFKVTVVSAMTESEDVLFHWCMLSAETEEEDAKIVFDMLVDLWIPVRGFSFASLWVEVYKQEKKRGLQHSKALRKEIH